MAHIAAALALFSVGMAIVLSVMIVHEVSKRGVKINFLLLRLLIIQYIHQYNQLTRKESGKIGPLYYPCIVSYNLALVLAVTYLLIR